MRHRPYVRIAIILLITFFAAFIYKQKDLSFPVNRTEKIVLECLDGFDLTEKDIVSRVEESWEKRNIKGKTVSYVFDLDEPLCFTEITSLIRKRLKSVRGIELSRIIYRKSASGRGIVVLEISLEGNVIISLQISNVAPAWKNK